ncbi:SusC/RagA family TonB-linked outer membrane protein [Sphingobacterium sp. 1.A.5]|uniref:SusC/RagA family TonB-linked outer membrane protein n=1 Tax=Sphingobacterium sp. 1.A.5 TaxID=2044604 RepID=UPI000C0BF392|nr:SusC/RagA family TonB-linked outer membrane protein [Sphingobacterium sp. 1.A.5]
MQNKTFKNAIPKFFIRSSSAVKPFINENHCLKENFLFPILLTIGFFLLGHQLVAQENLSMGTKGKLATGTVLDAVTGKPVQGVSIRGLEVEAKTDSMGRFQLPSDSSERKISLSHVGNRDTAVLLDPSTLPMEIMLVPVANMIEQVEVVSTGYQQIPRERATGSFALVDSRTLQRSPSMNILSRLNGVTNGLLLDRNTGNADGMSIRGRSTLFSSTRPLVVVDNFPYEGDINSLNPSDIESVTVLKDATAASIWGVRSANGVIVITTKKAKETFSAEFSSNLTVSDRPDLFYQKRMGSAELIELESFLFSKGEYTRALNSSYEDVSPVVDVLDRLGKGEISSGRAEGLLQQYAGVDNRKDLSEIFYRPKFEQQYYLGLSSSSRSVRSTMSVGYDRSLKETVSVDQQRLNLRASSQWKDASDRFGAEMNLWYSGNSNSNGNALGFSPRFPYERLLGDDRAPLEVSAAGTLRKSYTDTVGNGMLLDWKYRPVEELRGEWNSYSRSDRSLRYDFGARGAIYRSLALKVNFLSSTGWQDWSTLYDPSSFFVRNMVNQFSSIDPSTGTVTRPVPLGAIMDRGTVRSDSRYGRAQLDWNETLWEDHRLSGLLGAEWRQDRVRSESPGYIYGYDRDLENFAEVDIFSFFPIYHNGDYRRIERYGSLRRQVDNNRSWFGLMSYTFKDNLTVTASARKDASNIFGVSANQKGVPLWSLGTSYSFQDLLGWPPLDRLKLRVTYGYNGNVDKSTTAFLTSVLYQNRNLWGSPADRITNPPNSALRWERVSNLNIGLDFQALGNRFGGSLEYYIKRGKDLMGNSPIAPQTGVTEFYGNVARTKTRGIDAQVWVDWVRSGAARFRTDLIYNHTRDRVVDYYAATSTNSDVVTASGIFPIAGNPINSLVLYRSAGLDHKGDPMGYLGGKESDEYSGILNGFERDALIVMGSMSPTHYGSLRNTLSFNGFEISFQLLYKLGNYLRRTNSMNSSELIAGRYTFSDYHRRWQRPGDEATTQVPRFVYPRDLNREEFYQHSSVLAYSGSAVRLQDLRVSYAVLPFASHRKAELQLFLHANNLGIIWRANGEGLDPDIGDGIPSPFEMTLGIKLNYWK